MTITVGRPRVVDNRLEVPVSADGQWFREPTFWAEYDGIDISELPEQLLVVPALGTAIPVAWALGETLTVDSVDADFAAAVQAMGPEIATMYPGLAAHQFRLEAATIKSGSTPKFGAVQLYSGGVDSATTLIRHREEVRELVSVWGADVALENHSLWHQLADQIRATPLVAGLRHITVRSNLLGVIDVYRLSHRFKRALYGVDWWPALHHGLGLTALAAPVAAALGREHVYVASSHSVDFEVPWGSAPQLDNLIRFAGSQVIHDGFEYNRQGKFNEVIAPWVRDGGQISLAVCYMSGRGRDGLNCGRCEKCMRTAFNAMVSGLEPSAVGVPATAADLARWRDKLDAGAVTFAPNERHHWNAIKGGLRRRDDTQPAWIEEDLNWLREFDFASVPPEPGVHMGAMAALRENLEYGAMLAFRRLPFRWKQAVRRRLQP